jgi:hypothetical protein
MRLIFVVGILLFLVTGCNGKGTAEQPTRVHNQSEHRVVVIVVDSLTDRSIHTAMNDPRYKGVRYLMSHGRYISDVVASFPSMSVSDLSTIVTGVYPSDHHIPGLVWFDTDQKRIVNYGNNLQQTLTLGTTTVSRNALFDLNQTHLSKHVRTIFEDLEDAGYRTGAVNMLVYRGHKPHQLTLPLYARPFAGTAGYTVHGPDTLVFGQFTSPRPNTDKDGPFHQFGLNDGFSTDALIQLIKTNQLPDFTMVYLPSNDTVVHKYGVDAMQGVANADRDIQKVLSSYGSWDDTLKHLTLIVMGDGGVTPVLPKRGNPTILISDVFPKHTVYRWGQNPDPNDDVALAINSRIAYVYLLNRHLKATDVVERLKGEPRIDLIAWNDGSGILVTKPENHGPILSFRKNGPLTDPYGERWAVAGNQSILDINIGPHHTIAYGKYPDALHQVWSAAHCQKGTYIIVTAKRGYQFGDECAPKHNGGAQQASLTGEDVYTPIMINGTNHVPKKPLRFVDLKRYFISLVTEA